MWLSTLLQATWDLNMSCAWPGLARRPHPSKIADPHHSCQGPPSGPGTAGNPVVLLAGKQLRCVGSALSPNGLAFSEHGVISLALMDKILKIDKENMQVSLAPPVIL